MLVCECGSHAIEITSATEQTDENGNVTTFTENYECPHCGGNGTYRALGDGRDRCTGCLTTKKVGW